MAGGEEAALNEAVARDVNEGIEAAHREVDRQGYVRIVCECGQATCPRVLAITVEEYEEVRADPRRFAVAHEHVMPSIERVVADRGRFLVVEKSPGGAGEVAVQTDPRTDPREAAS
ncbi:MAG: hypothetical protein NVSMB32_01410 [Actinomycetota bacterium]